MIRKAIGIPCNDRSEQEGYDYCPTAPMNLVERGAGTNIYSHLFFCFSLQMTKYFNSKKIFQCIVSTH